ncbi:rod shape-determining protein [Micromonospora sp. NPDC048999]|uniref:rod shape-determining protein n=1 Tax=Micromonospora sp. NPDC048999 TaxID=3155391 RepID=UPI0033E7D838
MRDQPTLRDHSCPPTLAARPGARWPVALDLGTSTVRVWAPTSGKILTEPAVITYGRSGRQPVGRAALDLARTGGARLVWPVRQGVVEDFFGCVRLLRVLLAAAGRPDGDPSPVLVGVPATATLRQKNLLVAAVRRAAGGRVTAVEEPLAAALACRADLHAGDIVAVDIGHGRTEVVRIADGAIVSAERVDLVNPIDQVPAIADCVRRLNAGQGWTGHRRLLLTGGGAMHPGTAARLAALTGRSVTMPPDPPLATLTGLRLLLTDVPASPAVNNCG